MTPNHFFQNIAHLLKFFASSAWVRLFLYQRKSCFNHESRKTSIFLCYVFLCASILSNAIWKTWRNVLYVIYELVSSHHWEEEGAKSTVKEKLQDERVAFNKPMIGPSASSGQSPTSHGPSAVFVLWFVRIYACMFSEHRQIP